MTYGAFLLIILKTEALANQHRLQHSLEVARLGNQVVLAKRHSGEPGNRAGVENGAFGASQKSPLVYSPVLSQETSFKLGLHIPSNFPAAFWDA